VPLSHIFYKLEGTSITKALGELRGTEAQIYRTYVKNKKFKGAFGVRGRGAIIAYKGKKMTRKCEFRANLFNTARSINVFVLISVSNQHLIHNSGDVEYWDMVGYVSERRIII
jgi:hypothetical protein